MEDYTLKVCNECPTPINNFRSVPIKVQPSVSLGLCLTRYISV